MYKAKELKDYFYSSLGEDAHELMLKNNLGYVFEETKNEYEDYNRSLKIRQSIANIHILDEMIKINAFAGKNKIRYIFVKGLTLAHQLYKEPVKRFFGDIDLFVHPDDLSIMNKYLTDNDYYDENNNKVAEGSIFNYYLPTHLSELRKKNILLEIHMMPYYTNTICNSILPKEKIDNFFDKIEFIEINSHKFPILNNTANALFLLDHFIKHITYNIRYFDDYTEININKLVEARMFIDKFDVKFDDLYNLAIDYNSVPTLLLAYKYLNEIFGDTYISYDIDNYINELPLFENKIIGKLYHIKFNELIKNESNREFLVEIIKSLEVTPAQYIKIPKKKPGVCGKSFSIDTDNPTNIFHTHFQQKSLDREEIGFKLKGVVNWDENGINFNTIMLDKAYPDSDGNLIALRIFHSFDLPYQTEIFLIRKNIENYSEGIVNYDFIHEHNGEKRYLNNVSFVGIDGEGYCLSFFMPWNILGIKPVAGEKLHFEYTILRKNTKTIWDKICFGSIDRDFDPYSYSILELVD